MRRISFLVFISFNSLKSILNLQQVFQIHVIHTLLRPKFGLPPDQAITFGLTEY